jgi:hypothetical protein
MRAARVTACLIALVALSSTGGVNAASGQTSTPTPIVADVEGRPIKSALIPTFYCHDFDFPAIHCFRSPASLQAAKTTRSRLQSGPSVNFGVNDYVTIFDGANYTGGFMDVSQNYDVLFWIGWNDRISSFKARNSASGSFWTDWFHSGTGRNFCCNTNVNSLPAGQNDAWSSVYRT